MKERSPNQDKEPSLKERALDLWQNLEEVEDLYLADFPNEMPLVFSFGKVKVAINFRCENGNRDYGIGAMSISEQGPDYCEFRRDIVVRKREGQLLEYVVREYDIDPSTNHLPGDKNFPLLMPDLSQPISYYEKILEDSKNDRVHCRKIEHEEIDEAFRYLKGITVLLNSIDLPFEI